MTVQCLKYWPEYGRDNRLLYRALYNVDGTAYVILDMPDGDEYRPLVYRVPVVSRPDVLYHFNEIGRIDDEFRVRILPKLERLGVLYTLSGELGDLLLQHHRVLLDRILGLRGGGEGLVV